MEIEELRRELAATRTGFQRVEVVLVATTIMLAILGVTLTIFGIVGVWTGYSVVRNWAEAKAKETAEAEISRAIARVYIGLSYVEWARAAGEKDPSPAVTLGERALQAAQQAKDEERIAIAKSNLAYYYAHEKLADKKEIALEFAREGRASHTKYPKRLNLLSNDIYVRMFYAEDGDQATLGALKKDAEDLARRFAPLKGELTGYIAEIIAKCPALGGAPEASTT